MSFCLLIADILSDALPGAVRSFHADSCILLRYWQDDHRYYPEMGDRFIMTEAKSGIEFLENLRRQNGKERQTFDAFSSYLVQKARERGVPLYGEFELTPFCNLDCKMCYVHLNKDQTHGRSLLTVEQWKELIDQAYKAGMINATLTGGECLTYPGFKELFLYLHSLGCEVSVFTNGVLLDQEWVDFFKAHMPAEIQITLYGASDDTYQKVTGSRVFSTVVQHIRMLQDAALPVRICVTPSRYLGEDVFDTIRTAHELFPNTKVNSNLFRPKEETGRAGQEDDPDIEMYIRIFRYLASLRGQTLEQTEEDRLPEPGCPVERMQVCNDKASESTGEASGAGTDQNKLSVPQAGAGTPRGLLCGAGRSSFTIDWKGRMVPCSMMGMITADPLETGFLPAWKSINQAANSWPRPAECEECPYAAVCNNCAAYMSQLAKPGVRPESLCRRTRKLVSAGIFRIPDCE